MSDRYQYGDITQKSKEVLKNELNENVDEVNAHIESFRRWVTSMHHLKCPTDSKFLIKFLRLAKYDHIKAQRRLDNFCTVRASPRGCPHFFDYLNADHPIVERILNLKQITPLGHNDSGETVILVRMKGWNPDEIPFEQWIRVMFMSFDCFIDDEANQIHGLISLVDLEDVSRRAFEVVSEPKTIKKLMSIVQDALPIRLKTQVFYKEPVIFDIVYQILAFFMNEKLKSRCIRVKSDMHKAMEKVPGLHRILPTEYGGEGGSFETISDKWKTYFHAHFKHGNPLVGIEVNEPKRPKETMEFLKEYVDYKGVTLGTAGTYTKYDNVY